MKNNIAIAILLSVFSTMAVADLNTSIRGQINSRSDIKLYDINIISDHFVAEMVGNGVSTDSDYDPTLYLFDNNYVPIAFNDDKSIDVFSPRLELNDLPLGNYKLAVTDNDVAPFNSGSLLFLYNNDYTEQLEPVGVDGVTLPVTEWMIIGGTDKGYNGSRFKIDLTGATHEGLTIVDSEAFLTRLYLNILGRAPDPEGMEYWLNKLKTESAYYVVNGFFNSNEFLSVDIEDSVYIEILYDTFFDRAPDVEGLDYWTDKISRFGKLYVLNGFVFSDEFEVMSGEAGVSTMTFRERKDLIMEIVGSQFYHYYLNRVAGTSEIKHWVYGPLAGSVNASSFAIGIISSDEYRDLNRSDRDFIIDSYLAHFDRNPSEGEILHWSEEIRIRENGRAILVYEFSNSSEFRSKFIL